MYLDVSTLTGLLLRLVAAELDDHEVGCGGEALALEVGGHGAGERGEAGGRVLGAAAAQDLHRVKHLLRLKPGKLKCKQ